MTDTAPSNAAPVLYRVVVNHEDQYSIWPAAKSIPAGWRGIGDPDSRENCLNKIADLWTDMRPASIRATEQSATASQPQAS